MPIGVDDGDWQHHLDLILHGMPDQGATRTPSVSLAEGALATRSRSLTGGRERARVRPTLPAESVYAQAVAFRAADHES